MSDWLPFIRTATTPESISISMPVEDHIDPEPNLVLPKFWRRGEDGDAGKTEGRQVIDERRQPFADYYV